MTNYTENELSPEALIELANLNVNLGGGYRAALCEPFIDDSWLDEFIEETMLGFTAEETHQEVLTQNLFIKLEQQRH